MNSSNSDPNHWAMPDRSEQQRQEGYGLEDPLIAKMTTLFEMFEAACKADNAACDEPTIPADVPRFVTEMPWEN